VIIFPLDPKDVFSFRVFNAHKKIVVPGIIMEKAIAKRAQCVRKNVFQSMKPKTKKHRMELSVMECMYQYCHEPFFGGGHSLCFGYIREIRSPIASNNSRIRVNPNT